MADEKKGDYNYGSGTCIEAPTCFTAFLLFVAIITVVVRVFI